MTNDDPRRPDPADQAPTRPIAPEVREPEVAGAQSAATPGTPKRPWYRHVWVPIVGAGVLALLAFGSGFAVGQGTGLVRALTTASQEGPHDGPRGGMQDGPGGGMQDGPRAGDRGGMPGPGQQGPGARPGGPSGHDQDHDHDSGADVDSDGDAS